MDDSAQTVPASWKRFAALSVRNGWPVARLRQALPEDRAAVAEAFSLFAGALPEDSDSAGRFLAGPGSFLSGTKKELLIFARENRAAAASEKSERLAASFLAYLEKEKAGREAKRQNIRRALQEKNSRMNARNHPAEDPEKDIVFMREALREAEKAAAAGEIPVGAVAVKDGIIIGRGSNAPIRNTDPTAHAEILAIRDAALRLGNYRLEGTVLYVTLEPCPMCTGAIAHARVDRVVFGAADPKAGGFGGAVALASDPAVQRKIAVTRGVLENECREMLKRFFREKRNGKLHEHE